MVRGPRIYLPSLKKGISLDLVTVSTTPFIALTSRQTKISGTRSSRPRFNHQEIYLQGEKKKMLPVKYFSSTKKHRGTQTYNKFIQTEQIYPGSSFSYVQSRQPSFYVTTASLDGFPRSERRLPSRPHQKVPAQISRFHVRRKSLLLPSSTFRTKRSPLHFYKNTAISSQCSPQAKHQRSRIPRRLGDMGSDSRRDNSGCSNLGKTRYQAGVSTKSHKIKPNTQQRLSLVRSPLAEPTRQMGYPANQTGETAGDDQTIPLSSNMFSPAVGKSNRSPQFCITNPQPHTSSPPTSLKTSTSGTVLGQRSPKADPITAKEGLTAMAEPSITPANRTVSPTLGSDLPMDRCIDNRMGRAHIIVDGIGNMDITRTTTPYQSSGSKSSETNNNTIGSPECPDTLVHRQRTSPICSKETVCQSNITPAGDFATYTSHTQAKSESSPIQNLDSAQQQGRQPQQTEQQHNRLDSASGDLQHSYPEERLFGNRSYGHSQELQTSTIHITVPRSAGSRLQRTNLGLESVEADLLVPSEMVDPDCHQKATTIQTSRTDNSPTLHSGDMVPLHPNQSAGTLGNHTSRSNKEWTARLREVDRIQFLEELYEPEFGPLLSNKLIHAYKTVTDRQGQSNWKVFQNWLPKEITTITARTVMEFLVYLEEEKHLNPRTILNYRSRLRQPFQRAFNIDLNSEAFSLLARNQFLSNPPQRQKIPQWSIDKVLTKLSSEEFDLTSASPENTLIKTLFLTALASGNRVSELAAITRQNLSISEDTAILPTKPGFLFKNQSPKNPQAPLIQFPALGNDSTLCPVVALRMYLAKTASLPHDNILFVNPVSGKSLAAGRLSFWIVKAIRLGEPLASNPAGHDVRKLGHSIAFARGLDPQEILKNGFWNNQNVFVQKYLVSCNASTDKFVAGRHK